MLLALLPNLGLAGGQASDAPLFFGDLTTLFAAYMDDIRDANPTRRDTPTLIAHDLATVRAAHPNDLDDFNTLFAIHLS